MVIEYNAQGRSVEVTCTIDGELAGRIYAEVSGTTIRINRVDVVEAHQRKGVATAMFKRLRAELPSAVLERTQTYGDASKLWAAIYPVHGQPDE